ncbi:MAG: hypothetical protein ACKOQ6_05570 [Bacteroidota bacterium]
MSNDKIIALLSDKVALKQSVSDLSKDVFSELKTELKNLFDELRIVTRKNGQQIPIEFTDRSPYQAEALIGDDYLVFILLPTVATFDNDHEIWKTSYVKDNPNNSFVGKVYVYNFMADSFTFNRPGDQGILIGRIFVNKDRHFFVEGKKQLGLRFNDFSNAVLDRASIREILEAVVLHSLDFDPFAPPFDKVQMISVAEVQESTIQTRIATGKRLGFRFQADTGAL